MESQSKTRILLIGSGGVGTMAAYALETGGQAEVTAVLRSNFSTVQEHGFQIDSIEHGNNITNWRPTALLDHIPDMACENLTPFDYIIVASKNVPDVSPTVLNLLEPVVTSGVSTIVLLQNGLNIERPIISRWPDNIVLSAVSIISVSEPTHGHIVHEGADVSKLGPFPGLHKIPSSQAEAYAQRFLRMYNASGKVTWTYDTDVAKTRWWKLVYNATFNPVSAILQMGVIRMRMTQHVIDNLVLPAMREILVLAKAAGHELDEGVIESTILCDAADQDFMPSMGQDALKGNYMEMETIVGEPVREAKCLNVAVPTLEVIYHLLQGLQYKIKESKGYLKAEFKTGNPYA